MGFQAISQIHRPKFNVSSIAPYYGMNTAEIGTEAIVLGLAHRGTPGTYIINAFSLDATPGQGLYQYFAYPVAFGPAEFVDTDNGFIGGWDGANNDPWNVYGPIVVNVQGIPFYLYRTDHNDLGLCNWKTEVPT